MNEKLSRGLKRVTPLTLVDQVVESIVQAAIEGRFLPGDRLKERELAAELNVSRLPVREALVVLESRGLVVSSPYKGTRLIEVDEQKLLEISKVRAHLEQFALKEFMASRRNDKYVVAALRRAIAAMEASAAVGDGIAFARDDMEFHRQLCLATGNETFIELWESLSLRLTVILGIYTRELDLTRLLGGHVQLLDIFLAGDEADAQNALFSHVVHELGYIDYKTVLERMRRERKSN